MLTRLLTACIPAGNDPLQSRSAPEAHLVVLQAASSRPVHANRVAWSPCRTPVDSNQVYRILRLSPGESTIRMRACEVHSQPSEGPELRFGFRSASGHREVELSYGGVDP